MTRDRRIMERPSESLADVFRPRRSRRHGNAARVVVVLVWLVPLALWWLNASQ